jgi:hypothetical protein
VPWLVEWFKDLLIVEDLVIKEFEKVLYNNYNFEKQNYRIKIRQEVTKINHFKQVVYDGYLQDKLSLNDILKMQSLRFKYLSSLYKIPKRFYERLNSRVLNNPGLDYIKSMELSERLSASKKLRKLEEETDYGFRRWYKKVTRHIRHGVPMKEFDSTRLATATYGLYGVPQLRLIRYERAILQDAIISLRYIFLLKYYISPDELKSIFYLMNISVDNFIFSCYTKNIKSQSCMYVGLRADDQTSAFEYGNSLLF